MSEISAPARLVPPPTRLVTWMTVAFLAGWAVVALMLLGAGADIEYRNLWAFVIGGLGGPALLAITLGIRAYLAETGRVRPLPPEPVIPAPATITPEQRRGLRWVWPSVMIASIDAIISSLAVLGDWQDRGFRAEDGIEIPVSVVYLLVGIWMAAEANAMHDADALGLPGVALVAVVMTTLSGAGLALHWAPEMMVASVVLMGTTSMLAYRGLGIVTGHRSWSRMAVIAALATIGSATLPFLVY